MNKLISTLMTLVVLTGIVLSVVVTLNDPRMVDAALIVKVTTASLIALAFALFAGMARMACNRLIRPYV